jgi:hypothetical protein
MIARALVTAALERLREGWLEIVENGRRRGFGTPGAGLRATTSVHDPAFRRAAPRGSLRIAESYASGAWECDDLVSLVGSGRARCRASTGSERPSRRCDGRSRAFRATGARRMLLEAAGAGGADAAPGDHDRGTAPTRWRSLGDRS